MTETPAKIKCVKRCPKITFYSREHEEKNPYIQVRATPEKPSQELYSSYEDLMQRLSEIFGITTWEEAFEKSGQKDEEGNFFEIGFWGHHYYRENTLQSALKSGEYI